MRFSSTLSGSLPVILSLSTLLGCSAAEDKPADLDRILGSKPELSIFWNLVKNNTDYLFQLPTLGGVTLIAPNNDSFARIQDFDAKNRTQVNALLEYHTLVGSYPLSSIAEGSRLYATTKLTDRSLTNVTAGQHATLDKQRGGDVVVTSGGGSRATLVETDVRFAGGVVHVADALMTAPRRLEVAGLTSHRAELSAFVAACYAAGVIPDMSDASDVTIFAPVTAAFQFLGPSLTSLDAADLRRVLRYHLVPGKVTPASALQNGTKLSTAAGGEGGGGARLSIRRSGNQLFVNSAKVVVPDILIANGVVHLVDGVLNPDAPDVVPDPASDAQPPVFAVSASGTVVGGPTGARAPTPFTTALPCTANCPTPTSASSARSTSTSVRSSSSSGVAVAAARCTGAAMAVAAAGVVGGVLRGIV
ncbi:hypothetical protein GGTG_11787 [Gaeumannomyces tritici R3-111a-1]|uniref:FAS1 domain-containing protein n=1 Tax=Gaeumannomyces tritici (strain R3-111a-1) TaxID=644352 RepID=J3PE64_GAET3|nr:hypothetical protein GGTG_11787 [Gaeumannomyces tritici R3-111a-1]EJT70764.1 hypothetical protein GGTG_11787 [Gaeumannomyces tritici R3-111a-1]